LNQTYYPLGLQVGMFQGNPGCTALIDGGETHE